MRDAINENDTIDAIILLSARSVFNLLARKKGVGEFELIDQQWEQLLETREEERERALENSIGRRTRRFLSGALSSLAAIAKNSVASAGSIRAPNLDTIYLKTPSKSNQSPPRYVALPRRPSPVAVKKSPTAAAPATAPTAKPAVNNENDAIEALALGPRAQIWNKMYNGDYFKSITDTLNETSVDRLEEIRNKELQKQWDSKINSNPISSGNIRTILGNLSDFLDEDATIPGVNVSNKRFDDETRSEIFKKTNTKEIVIQALRNKTDFENILTRYGLNKKNDDNFMYSTLLNPPTFPIPPKDKAEEDLRYELPDDKSPDFNQIADALGVKSFKKLKEKRRELLIQEWKRKVQNAITFDITIDTLNLLASGMNADIAKAMDLKGRTPFTNTLDFIQKHTSLKPKLAEFALKRGISANKSGFFIKIVNDFTPEQLEQIEVSRELGKEDYNIARLFNNDTKISEAWTLLKDSKHTWSNKVNMNDITLTNIGKKIPLDAFYAYNLNIPNINDVRSPAVRAVALAAIAEFGEDAKNRQSEIDSLVNNLIAEKETPQQIKDRITSEWNTNLTSILNGEVTVDKIKSLANHMDRNIAKVLGFKGTSPVQQTLDGIQKSSTYNEKLVAFALKRGIHYGGQSTIIGTANVFSVQQLQQIESNLDKKLPYDDYNITKLFYNNTKKTKVDSAWTSLTKSDLKWNDLDKSSNLIQLDTIGGSIPTGIITELGIQMPDKKSKTLNVFKAVALAAIAEFGDNAKDMDTEITDVVNDITGAPAPGGAPAPAVAATPGPPPGPPPIEGAFVFRILLNNYEKNLDCPTTRGDKPTYGKNKPGKTACFMVAQRRIAKEKNETADKSWDRISNKMKNVALNDQVVNDAKEDWKAFFTNNIDKDRFYDKVKDLKNYP